MEHDHHLTTRAPVVNRPAHGIPTPRSQRAMGTVTGLRTAGYSWAEIGNRLGITRQAAQQRFGPTDTTGSTP